MTLIVGALFPWGELLKSPGFQLGVQLGVRRGVILAADSRWTYDSGETVGSAVKLFKIGESCIAAYAGGVAVGEDTIAALSTRLDEARTVQEFADMAQEILLDAWREHPLKGSGLEILLGESAGDGGAWLHHFSASDEFRPRYVEDMKVVAPPGAVQRFAKALEDITREALADPSKRAVSLRVESWAMMLQIAVKITGESEVEPGVGGGTLCGYTTLGKAHGQTVARVHPKSGGAFKVEELGIHPLEARMLRSHWKRRPPRETNR